MAEYDYLFDRAVEPESLVEFSKALAPIKALRSKQAARVARAGRRGVADANAGRYAQFGGDRPPLLPGKARQTYKSANRRQTNEILHNTGYYTPGGHVPGGISKLPEWARG